jgi:hypothetical protein
MDISIPKRTNLNNSNQTSPSNHDESAHRPHKFEKLSTPITGYSGESISIPEFVGPTPIIHSHISYNHLSDANKNEHLHQQQNHFQDQNPRNHHSSQNYSNQSPRNHSSFQNHSNQQNNGQPCDDEGPFCWYQEDHIQEGINNCKQSLIGKLLTEIIIPKQIVHNTLLGI